MAPLAIEHRLPFADQRVELPQAPLDLLDLSSRRVALLLAPRALQFEHAELELHDVAFAAQRGSPQRRWHVQLDHVTPRLCMKRDSRDESLRPGNV